MLLFCRFNGEDFLSRLRGKSIMFVGDSLGLNQWQSLTCMLHIAVPQAPYSLARNGDVSIFTFPVRSLLWLLFVLIFFLYILSQSLPKPITSKQNNIQTAQAITATQNRAKAENSAQHINQNHSFSHVKTTVTIPSIQFVTRWIDSKILLEVYSV